MSGKSFYGIFDLPSRPPSNATVVSMVAGDDDESYVFNKQVESWNLECRKRLQETKILVIGLNGLGSEVVKHLLTNGMRCITIMDDTVVSESDISSHIFCFTGDLGKKRSEASLPAIQELNTSAQILIATGNCAEKDDEFYADFEVVFATDLPIDSLCKINNICQVNNAQFYCADTWGFYGYCFLDLHHHKYKSYVKENIKSSDKIIAKFGIGHKAEGIVEEELRYFRLAPTLLAKARDGLSEPVNKVYVLIHIVNHFRELFLRYPQPANRESDMKQLLKIRNVVCKNLGVTTTEVPDKVLSFLFGELSPVCTALGGILANEIIKGVSRSGSPICNYIFYDGIELESVVELITGYLDEEI